MAISIRTAIPGPKSQELLEKRHTQIPRGLFQVAPVFVAQASGATLTDVDGNTFLDFACGIGVNNLGHRPEHVVSAVEKQMGAYAHLCFNVTPYENYLTLAEKLNAATPGSFAKKTFFVNSGAEAVENAIKVARAYTGRQAVVCFDHAFHGRTYLAMSLTSKVTYKSGFAPFCPEIYRAPFPYAYRWPGATNETDAAKAALKQFEDMVHSQISAKSVAAVIIEPVLGEGGFIPVPKTFLNGLREFCSAHGIVLIADEIQTGFGRTGKLFACEHSDCIPDILISAKALGGGLPLAAVTGRAEILDAPIEGGVGGTFGGNPVSCAAALGVFKHFEETGILKNAYAMGKILETRMATWKDLSPFVGDVRGLGPMRAAEFVKDRNSREPYSEFAKKLVGHSLQRGLIVMTAGTYGNVLRILIPLSITRSELEEGLNVLEQGLSELSAQI